MSKHIDYHLREANPDDAEQLTKLAFLSKAHWGYSNELLELWQDQLTVTPEMIKQSASFVIEINNDIVGFWCRSTTQTSNIIRGSSVILRY